MLRDPRIEKMARIIVEHSLKVQPGERVLIDALDNCDELIIAVVNAVYGAGASPQVQQMSLPVLRSWLRSAKEEHLSLWYEHTYRLRREMDCILSLRGQDNGYEMVDVPVDTMRQFSNLKIKVGQEARKPGFRTTVIRFPSKSLAQQAGMSTEAFADHFFRVCALDYPVLHREMLPLKDALDKANEVRIVAPGTDLLFSIEGIECNISAGTWNIPDGETAMGIVRESVEGKIAYNIPSNHHGYVFRDIALTFRKGKVEELKASDPERMEAILDVDEGARYIGEFAIGINPYLQRHMTDTLFDEKMAGSLHFTPGGTDAAGNRSTVHWDIVQSHLPFYGGGEIFLDGKLWRKDGLFLDQSLKGLNPEPLQSTLESI